MPPPRISPDPGRFYACKPVRKPHGRARSDGIASRNQFSGVRRLPYYYHEINVQNNEADQQKHEKYSHTDKQFDGLGYFHVCISY